MSLTNAITTFMASVLSARSIQIKKTDPRNSEFKQVKVYTDIYPSTICT